jgi:hypothetical protein
MFFPLVISCWEICLAMSMGMAKPSPCAPWIMAVLTPMTSPRALSKGLKGIGNLGFYDFFCINSHHGGFNFVHHINNKVGIFRGWL